MTVNRVGNQNIKLLDILAKHMRSMPWSYEDDNSL